LPKAVQGNPAGLFQIQACLGAKLIMAIHRSGYYMRTRIMISAILLSLGLVPTVWASSHVQPEPAGLEMAPPLLNEPRQKPLTPPVPPRGQLLYENHCMSCHESVVHIRTDKRTRSLPELRTRVLQWAEYLKLHWGSEELEDVVSYLDSEYYKFEVR
jgi:hypothetical protein